MKNKQKISLVLICFLTMCLFTGCGVSHSSPEGVVKSLVKYCGKGKEKKVLDCYGLKKDADDGLKAQGRALIDYFEAMKAKGITLVDCKIIKEFDSYAYVYISYNVEIKKDKAYPRMDTYFVSKKDKKYYVMTPQDITTEMSQEAEEAYKEFMTTSPYKDYQKAYDAFILKNPSFEEEMSMKLQ